MEITNLNASYAVALHVSLIGGISYKRDYKESTVRNDGAEIRKWETESVVLDKEERNEATKLKSRIYNLVDKATVKTLLGPVCQKEKREALEKALEEVDKVQEDFNNEARTCHLDVHYAIFSISPGDPMMVKVVADQVISATQDIEEALTLQDRLALNRVPKRFLGNHSPGEIMLLPETERDALLVRVRAELIRNALKNLKGVETLFPGDASQEILNAVKEARIAARRIIQKVDKKKESLEEILKETSLSGVKRTRAFFIQSLQSLAGEVVKQSPEEESPEEKPVSVVLTTPIVKKTTCQFPVKRRSPIINVSTAPTNGPLQP